MEDLNRIFINYKATIDDSNARINSIVYANLDNLKIKEWAQNYWNWDPNDIMMDYFKSESYKMEAIHYFQAYMKTMEEIIKFKLEAINVYKEIEKLIGGRKEFPDYISYSINNPEFLNQFTGTFLEYKLESNDMQKEFVFLVEDNLLYLKYHNLIADEKYNVPLYRHKDFTFFYFGKAGIWKFEMVQGADIFFTFNMFGHMDKYIKITKD